MLKEADVGGVAKMPIIGCATFTLWSILSEASKRCAEYNQPAGRNERHILEVELINVSCY
jgi:hypothetical protein